MLSVKETFLLAYLLRLLSRQQINTATHNPPLYRGKQPTFHISLSHKVYSCFLFVSFYSFAVYTVIPKTITPQPFQATAVNNNQLCRECHSRLHQARIKCLLSQRHTSKPRVKQLDTHPIQKGLANNEPQIST